MELKDVKLNHLQNLAVVNCGDIDLSVAVVDRGVAFAERNNIYISFWTREVAKCDENEDFTIESFAILKHTEDYPSDTAIGDLCKVEPIKRTYWETYLNFCGVVTDVKKVPRGTIDKYTKDILFGYLVTIKTEDLTFVFNLAHCSDIADIFPCVTEAENPCYVPKVGDRIKGRSDVVGVLF